FAEREVTYERDAQWHQAGNHEAWSGAGRYSSGPRSLRRCATAAAVLEVLAGERTPTEAAGAIGVSVPRYYQIESRALRGLLDACQPRPRGPGRSIDKELTTMRHESQRLQRELTRQQALLRAAQRMVGLTPPAAAPTRKNGKKIRKRRTARALSVAVRLQ